MKSIRKTFNINDEYYTPKVLVEILEPHLKQWRKLFMGIHKREPIIWCPFDTENSEFCLYFKENNYKYIYSHIKTGQDFFDYTPEFDIAISNPPFSQKVEVFKKLFSLNKPFVMLMNIMAINYQIIGNLFYNNPIQLLIPDKKVTFDGGHQTSFCSGYVCKDFLFKDLIFCHIADDYKKRYFLSRMNNDIINEK
jgi:hypothetical protein